MSVQSKWTKNSLLHTRIWGLPLQPKVSFKRRLRRTGRQLKLAPKLAEAHNNLAIALNSPLIKLAPSDSLVP